MVAERVTRQLLSSAIQQLEPFTSTGQLGWQRAKKELNRHLYVYLIQYFKHLYIYLYVYICVSLFVVIYNVMMIRYMSTHMHICMYK